MDKSNNKKDGKANKSPLKSQLTKKLNESLECKTVKSNLTLKG